jgi:hypothetical protein
MPKQKDLCNTHVLTANNLLQQQKPQRVSNWGQLKKMNLLTFNEVEIEEARVTTSGIPVKREWECLLNFLGKTFAFKSPRKNVAENEVAKQFVEHISSTPPN